MKKFYSHYFVLALALTTTSVLTTSCAGNKAQKAQLAEIIEDVKKTLPVISHANRFYHDKNDKDAATVEMLENEEYLAIDEGSKKLFKYTLILENEKLIKISATSTKYFPDGAGKVIFLTIDTWEFSGYLID